MQIAYGKFRQHVYGQQRFRNFISFSKLTFIRLFFLLVACAADYITKQKIFIQLSEYISLISKIHFRRMGIGNLKLKYV